MKELGRVLYQPLIGFAVGLVNAFLTDVQRHCQSLCISDGTEALICLTALSVYQGMMQPTMYYNNNNNNNIITVLAICLPRSCFHYECIAPMPSFEWLQCN